MDVSHSVCLYVNQIFSSTEPIFLEIRRLTFSSDQEEAMLETGESLSYL